MLDHDRVERLLASNRLLDGHGEGCCVADAEQRVAGLQSLARSVPEDDPEGRAALRALGDGTRNRLVRLLAAAEGELCVCELAPLVEVGESAVSHALSDLREADLVTRRREGTWHFYDTTPLAERLLDALDADPAGEVPAGDDGGDGA